MPEKRGPRKKKEAMEKTRGFERSVTFLNPSYKKKKGGFADR